PSPHCASTASRRAAAMSWSPIPSASPRSQCLTRSPEYPLSQALAEKVTLVLGRTVERRKDVVAQLAVEARRLERHSIEPGRVTATRDGAGLGSRHQFAPGAPA